MMYKLIAIDLDGTLLNSYGQISQENKNEIENAIKHGCEVVLASGRNAMSVFSLANEIGANHYAISGNGAIIYDLQKNEIIYNQFINKKKVLQLISICEENSIYYSVYTQNSIIAKSLNYNVLFYHQENANKIDEQKTKIYVIENVYEYVQQRKEEDYLKINICDENSIIFKNMIQKLRKVKDIDVLDVAHMSRKLIRSGTETSSIEYYYTEISKSNVDKWTAIEFLINLLKIEKEEVVAIGDNVNDKTMIQNAGLGIAMENSAPYIKKVADFVTKDNNESGVAEAIKSLKLS